MAAYDLEGLLDVVPIKRTELVGNALSTIVAFLAGPERAPGDPLDNDPQEGETTEVDWWQHYGFLSRPPSGTESLIVRVGAQTFAIASRLLSARAFGKMNEGDVAMYSTGGNVIRLNHNGSISMLAPDKRGKQMVCRFDPKGEISMMLGNGFIMQLSEEAGFVVNVPGKDITFAARNVTVLAQALMNMSPVFKANASAVAPLVPTSANPGVLV